MQNQRDAKNRYGLGIKKIDDSLGGGLTPNNLYLLLGGPGSGRTTMALQFLVAGLKKSHKGLLITFAENKDEVQKIAGAHQLKLKKIDIVDFGDFVKELKLFGDKSKEIFTYQKLEEIVNHLIHHILTKNPDRLVIDVMSFFRVLQREQTVDGLLIWLREACATFKATTLLIDHDRGEVHEMAGLAHGILKLTSEPSKFQFTFDIPKLRGLNTSGRVFNLKLGAGGFEALKDDS